MAASPVASTSTPIRLRETSLPPGSAGSPHYSTSLRSRHSLYGTEDRVVLDLGSRIWTYGFSGENTPRGVVDVSRFGATSEEGIWTPDCARVWYADPTAEAAVEAKVQEGLRWIFHRELMTDPRQRKVIIAENPLLPTIVKDLIARVLFDRLQVLSVSFSSTHMLAMLPTGVVTGLVIDCGFHETSLLPIYAARPLMPFLATTPRAGLALLRRLRKLLLRFGSYIPPVSLTAAPGAARPRPQRIPAELLTMSVLEDIKYRGLLVGHPPEPPDRMDVDPARAPSSDPPADTFDEDDELIELEHRYAKTAHATSATLLISVPGQIAKGTLLLPGWIRERAAEVLFELGDIDEPGLATLVVDTLLRLPTDLRRTLAGSILVTGGTSMLSGFQPRLVADIRRLLASPKHPLSAIQRTVSLLNDRAPAFTTCMLPWLGGSLAGALKTGGEEVAREKYDVAGEAGSTEGGEGTAERVRERRRAVLPNWTQPALH